MFQLLLVAWSCLYACHPAGPFLCAHPLLVASCCLQGDKPVLAALFKSHQIDKLHHLPCVPPAVVATCEVVNCTSVDVQCTATVPTVAVDKCDGCQVGQGGCNGQRWLPWCLLVWLGRSWWRQLMHTIGRHTALPLITPELGLPMLQLYLPRAALEGATDVTTAKSSAVNVIVPGATGVCWGGSLGTACLA